MKDSIEVHEHPVPLKWEIGTLSDYVHISVFVEWIATGAYAVTLAGNYMEKETGEFYNLSTPSSSFLYPTLYAAFEAFQKFYR